jgi:RNA recognition motif-containing protein
MFSPGCGLVFHGLESIVTIYVGNLSFQATEEDLREVFAEYGEVSRVSLPTDRETGRKRGFAFVEMKEETQEDQAIAELDGAEWLGREIRVNKAKPRESSAGGARRNGSFSRN